jgi:hypothetical protein
VVASSLQDDLLGIPGVEGVEVDGSNDAPAGLRIRIAQGADQDAVGGAIRRVLSAHGLGTDTQLPGEVSHVPTASVSAEAASNESQSPVSVLTADEPTTPSPIADVESDDETGDEGETVIDLTDQGAAQPVGAATDSEASAAQSADESSDPIGDSSPSGSWDPEHYPSFVEARRTGSVGESPEVLGNDDPASSQGGGHVARIDSIAVVEGRSGIIISVTASDGTETSVAASSTEGGVEQAVVKATAQLFDPDSPDPIVIEIEDRRVDAVDIVMVVLDADGTLVTGSAVVSAGRAFALGRATWAALAL